MAMRSYELILQQSHGDIALAAKRYRNERRKAERKAQQIGEDMD
jgi:hypothetical protein